MQNGAGEGVAGCAIRGWSNLPVPKLRGEHVTSFEKYFDCGPKVYKASVLVCPGIMWAGVVAAALFTPRARDAQLIASGIAPQTDVRGLFANGNSIVAARNATCATNADGVVTFSVAAFFFNAQEAKWIQGQQLSNSPVSSVEACRNPDQVLMGAETTGVCIFVLNDPTAQVSSYACGESISYARESLETTSATTTVSTSPTFTATTTDTTTGTSTGTTFTTGRPTKVPTAAPTNIPICSRALVLPGNEFSCGRAFPEDRGSGWAQGQCRGYSPDYQAPKMLCASREFCGEDCDEGPNYECQDVFIETCNDIKDPCRDENDNSMLKPGDANCISIWAFFEVGVVLYCNDPGGWRDSARLEVFDRLIEQTGQTPDDATRDGFSDSMHEKYCGDRFDANKEMCRTLTGDNDESWELCGLASPAEPGLDANARCNQYTAMNVGANANPQVTFQFCQLPSELSFPPPPPPLSEGDPSNPEFHAVCDMSCDELPVHVPEVPTNHDANEEPSCRTFVNGNVRCLFGVSGASECPSFGYDIFCPAKKCKAGRAGCIDAITELIPGPPGDLYRVGVTYCTSDPNQCTDVDGNDDYDLLCRAYVPGTESTPSVTLCANEHKCAQLQTPQSISAQHDFTVCTEDTVIPTTTTLAVNTGTGARVRRDLNENVGDTVIMVNEQEVCSLPPSPGCDNNECVAFSAAHNIIATIEPRGDGSFDLSVGPLLTDGNEPGTCHDLASRGTTHVLSPLGNDGTWRFEAGLGVSDDGGRVIIAYNSPSSSRLAIIVVNVLRGPSNIVVGSSVPSAVILGGDAIQMCTPPDMMTSPGGEFLVYQGRTDPASSCSYIIKSLEEPTGAECVMRPVIALANGQSRSTSQFSWKGILKTQSEHDLLAVDGSDILTVPLNSAHFQQRGGGACPFMHTPLPTFRRMAFVRTNPRA